MAQLLNVQYTFSREMSTKTVFYVLIDQRRVDYSTQREGSNEQVRRKALILSKTKSDSAMKSIGTARHRRSLILYY